MYKAKGEVKRGRVRRQSEPLGGIAVCWEVSHVESDARKRRLHGSPPRKARAALGTPSRSDDDVAALLAETGDILAGKRADREVDSRAARS